MATQTQTQMQDDVRLAQQLQEAEFARAQGHPPVVAGVAVPGPGGYAPGYPPGQAPMSYGSPAGVGGLPIAVVPELPMPEVLALSYRRSLKCFACIDVVSTVFNTTTWIVDARADRESTSLLGYRGLMDDTGWLGFLILALVGLVFLVGPLCGYMGATKLDRSLVAVYLVFCLAKAGWQVAAAILRPHLWFFIIALIQVWIAKIVFTFWRALGMIEPQRLEQLRSPQFAVGVPTRIVYW